MFSREGLEGRLVCNVTRESKIREAMRESAPTLKDTFQDWVFPREERTHMVLTLEPYARFQVVALGALQPLQRTGNQERNTILKNKSVDRISRISNQKSKNRI